MQKKNRVEVQRDFSKFIFVFFILGFCEKFFYGACGKKKLAKMSDLERVNLKISTKY